MQLAEINLDTVIYLVLGLIWLIAQIASMAARGRRQQQVKTAPAPPPDGASAPGRTPTPAPARELRDFLQTLVSGESPPRPPTRSTPPDILVKDRERAARVSATSAQLRRDVVPPLADAPAVTRVTSMPRATGQGLSTLRATPFPRMSMPPGFLMRQDRVSRSTDTTAAATAMRRRASTPALREAILYKILLDPPRALTPPGGGSWWDPRRG